MHFVGCMIRPYEMVPKVKEYRCRSTTSWLVKRLDQYGIDFVEVGPGQIKGCRVL